MQVELGGNATYLVIGMGSISFCMPSSDVLELDDVLYVPGLTKNLLSISAMTDLRCVAEFDDQQVIIKDHLRILVEFWPEVCERVAFTGYLLIQSNMEP
jgi:hypothetical protein